jgi:probable HAF family extracellular repeat protein
MSKTRLKAWMVGAGVVAICTSPMAAVRYTAKDVTPAGTTSCIARAVNASGQVVGDVTNGEGGLSGFVTAAGGNEPRVIPAPGWDWMFLVDINDTGVAVGYVRSNQGEVVRHPIFVDPGATTFKELGTLGGTSATVRAINNKGRLVGYSTLADGRYQAFEAKWPDTVMRPIPGMTNAAGVSESGVLSGYADLDTVITGKKGQGQTTVDLVNGSRLWIMSMNDKGQIAGYYADAEGHEFAAVTGPNAEDPRSLDIPSISSWAYRIGRDGSVIGEYFIDEVGYSAFIVTPKGRWLDLNRWVQLDNGDSLAAAHGINDLGQIAANSETKCYLLTPIPQ